jgi:hypothetical protein
MEAGPVAPVGRSSLQRASGKAARPRQQYRIWGEDAVAAAAVGDDVGSPAGACCLNPAGLDAMVTLSPGRHLPLSAAPSARKEAGTMQPATQVAAAAHEREVRG